MNKRRTLLAAAVLVPVAALAVAAGRLDDTQAVKKNAEDFAKAWNSHNAATLAEFWARDGDLICPMQDVNKNGRTEVQGYFKEQFASGQPLANSNIDITKDDVRFITPDVALQDLDVKITGCTDSSGTAQGPMEQHVVVISKKEGGDWKFAAARPGMPYPQGQKGMMHKNGMHGNNPMHENDNDNPGNRNPGENPRTPTPRTPR